MVFYQSSNSKEIIHAKRGSVEVGWRIRRKHWDQKNECFHLPILVLSKNLVKLSIGFATLGCVLCLIFINTYKILINWVGCDLSLRCIFWACIITNALTLFHTSMKIRINALKIQLKRLEEKIRAVEDQLPAHSVKPPIMTKLFELEDQRDAILKELEHLESQMDEKTI